MHHFYCPKVYFSLILELLLSFYSNYYIVLFLKIAKSSSNFKTCELLLIITIFNFKRIKFKVKVKLMCVL